MRRQAVAGSYPSFSNHRPIPDRIGDLILIPLLVLFLGATIWALRRDRPRHGRAGPEGLAWAAALATVGGLWISAVVVGAGLALLIAASVWNWKLVRSRRTVDPKTVEA